MVIKNCILLAVDELTEDDELQLIPELQDLPEND